MYCDYVHQANRILSFLTNRQTPVHAEVNRDEHEVLCEDVDVAALRPALDARVAVAHEFRVEERVEGVHGCVALTLTAVHQHVHVEVDDLLEK